MLNIGINTMKKDFRNRLLSLLGVSALMCISAAVLASVNDKKVANDWRLSVTQSSFGVLENGTPIQLYTLTNRNGLQAQITNYGGILVSLKTPDRNGDLDDIVLGYDTIEEYEEDRSFQGPLIGRFGNRINQGSFTIDGKHYQLSANRGGHHLHGGIKGFGKKVWQAQAFAEDNSAGVRLSRLSHDGEEGYPGNLSVEATYRLDNNNQLHLTFVANTDKPTPINLTQHAYYNLAGGGTIVNHLLTIPASQFTPVNEQSIPLGENRSVKGTPFDFTEEKTVGADINDDTMQMRYGKGYDHNWVLDKSYAEMGLMIKVQEPVSGRVMEIHSTEPGLQFYSGNFLNGNIVGKGGEAYQYRTGIVLEPQHFPDSPNQDAFPSTILMPEQTYKNHIIYKFYTEE
jgi:aldose 1-epimerase